MIASAIIFIVWAFVYAVSSPLRLLPNASLPTDVASTLTTIGGYLTSMESVIPVGTLLSVLGAVIAIEGGVFLYKVFMWIVRRIPTQS